MTKLAKPRPVVTPYGFFINICREQWNKKNPEEQLLKFSELQGPCWKKWQEMTDFQKKRFEFMSEFDEARYNKEMIKFQEEKKRKKVKSLFLF